MTVSVHRLDGDGASLAPCKSATGSCINNTVYLFVSAVICEPLMFMLDNQPKDAASWLQF